MPALRELSGRCLSVTSQYRDSWTDRTGFLAFHLSYNFTLCSNEIRVSPNTRELPSGTLSELWARKAARRDCDN